jgi:hypothetical protein
LFITQAFRKLNKNIKDLNEIINENRNVFKGFTLNNTKTIIKQVYEKIEHLFNLQIYICIFVDCYRKKEELWALIYHTILWNL